MWKMMSIVDYNAQKTAQLTKKTRGTRLSCFGSEYKMADSQGRNRQLLAKNIAQVARRHSMDDICYLETISKTEKQFIS